MYIFFADDSRQAHPSRMNMGPIVATGGFLINADNLKKLEDDLENVCKKFGFPKHEPFKWSPGKELWMKKNLTEGNRNAFFTEVLECAKTSGVIGVIIIEDSTSAPAIRQLENAEQDTTAMLLERIDKLCGKLCQNGLVIVARPQGGRTDEDKFLSDCVSFMESGTSYVKPKHISINVLTTPADNIRCLQLSDLLISSTVAYVSGEFSYSPDIFKKLKPLLYSYEGRIGGMGLKLHPDFKYSNLYHWLLGDVRVFKGLASEKLPIATYPYATSPDNW